MRKAMERLGLRTRFGIEAARFRGLAGNCIHGVYRELILLVSANGSSKKLKRPICVDVGT